MSTYSAGLIEIQAFGRCLCLQKIISGNIEFSGSVSATHDGYINSMSTTFRIGLSISRLQLQQAGLLTEATC